MSLPERPGGSPRVDGGTWYRQSPSGRTRPGDVEAAGYRGVCKAGRHGRGRSGSSFDESVSNVNANTDKIPLSPTGAGGSGGDGGSEQAMWRKRSLVRPERKRIGKDHRHYHYHKHASKMEVLPSATGNEVAMEELDSSTEPWARTNESVSSWAGQGSRKGGQVSGEAEKAGAGQASRGKAGKIGKASKRRGSRWQTGKKKKQGSEEQLGPPSFWNLYCAGVTFWCPDFVLGCFGKTTKAQRRAWREKMGLISIILSIMAVVGFLTFGFTATVCSAPPLRLQVNKVSEGFMIFHGVAYDLSNSHHPPAEGIALRQDGLGANVLYDLGEKHGGQDGSFLFQNVNGRCKGLIEAAEGSDVPTNDNGDLAWYFPCTTVKQDGSTEPNLTVDYYLGYGCHTTDKSRRAFYVELDKAADVYFTWEDIGNTSRNLMVYSGSVVDLDVLRWFNESQVVVPQRFKELRERGSAANRAVRGRDVTRMMQAGPDKAYAQCLEDIAKVGSVDTETVGCMASKVVLYCALTLILSVVLARFGLALVFQWFISRHYGAAKTSQSSDRRKRQRQIEAWSDDIYRAPLRLAGDVGSTVVGSERSRRTASFLPTTSRFSAVYGAGGRRAPTTMASQRCMAPSSQGAPHQGVVPQPPSDWMPFGFPLAHTMCLVTAYSEGLDGIRTTLDSIATTDYPNSHKAIVVICDGIIKGKGEAQSTPDVCLAMLKDHAVPPELVQPFSYVAVASGAKRHNMAQVYCGFYDYGPASHIPPDRQQRVPMMVIVKCGTPLEALEPKPGNRGKRDSQIILMSFLQKVMFDERMTELEYHMFNGLRAVTAISPDYYEIVLMVDADTKVFPDSLTHMVSAMVKDPEIMGLCGETKIANKRDSWVTAIQVFEYFISHHLAKSFESIFGGVTCLPGCFCMYRIKAPKGGHNYWVPILANPDIVEHYSENVVETLHEKNLYLLGEDRFLTTLMLRTFPKRKQVFVPQAVCKTTVPDKFMVLLSQRRRWINSTIHNLMELVLVRDLCGTFCFSMQFVIFVELVGTLVLPAAIAFTFYVVITSIVHSPPQIIPLVLLALILGLPGVLIIVTAHSWSYVVWMLIYLLSLPIWNFVLPTYAFWKFDDFSWGDTRKTAGDEATKGRVEHQGEFDSSKITMKRWAEFERDKRSRSSYWGSRENIVGGGGSSNPAATWALPLGHDHLQSQDYHHHLAEA
ncbi:hypothetical protein CDD81_3044 [Ophiocordyceps australis]|uniref:chitin synthase n=1 Tax=Ophiocordyceps australis TaxID=1399860 RepID=A0A2C5YCN6_9HYPO|nr:hypothetical protein CDD81_3044 [Ophiocordyceps australis]